MSTPSERQSAEARFARVFAHLPVVVSYARRRGSADPEALAAEAMAIAWRRLADVPAGEPRPWLIATARNLVWEEWRRRSRSHAGAEPAAAPGFLEAGIDPDLEQALRALSYDEREAVLLVAWDDLTPAQAARCLGITATAFRVRLHRARRRLRAALERGAVESTDLEMGHA
jgi:RNA polymerase sigma factor (sigma-70 family)